LRMCSPRSTPPWPAGRGLTSMHSAVTTRNSDVRSDVQTLARQDDQPRLTTIFFCLLTMNHHPLHTDAHYAEEPKHRVSGATSLWGISCTASRSGMSVADISGKAIGQSRGRVAQAREPNLPRRHDLRRDHRARQNASRPAKPTAASSPSRREPSINEASAFASSSAGVMVPKREAGELQPADHPGRRELTWARER